MSADTEILDYSHRYADAFATLNIEWLEKYFRVEPIDHEILSDPEKSVLAPGGAILYARKGSEIVGTIALKYQAAGVFELTKMAVTERCQGAGIGRLLLQAAIRRFEALGGERLYLESHSSLVAALSLYEASGFVHVPPPAESDYERADVYMIYRPD